MNPYRIEGPALISFSGGRTSGYMLWRILQAHGGELPPGVHVCFANTGKEREETLRFVHECGSRWGVRIRWFERVPHSLTQPFDQRFSEIGYNSASRSGEPFSDLVAKKGYLPNAVTRFCTSELKVRVMTHFMRSIGVGYWQNIVGLRADEPKRVAKVYGHVDDNGEPLPDLLGVVQKGPAKRRKRERWTTALPLALGGVTRRDVLTFWFGKPVVDLRIPRADLPQGFDLGLEDHEGNCDGCFLKSYGKLCAIERARPGTMDWWVAQERAVGASARRKSARFVTEYSYADIQIAVQTSPELPWDQIDSTEREHDAECGLWCG